ncbi:hypothetical protein IAD21_02784 [Abditibacteriota bacterium]|nr:hypothetical protein IAD21_02784 [Abditibacteriota bacterium]
MLLLRGKIESDGAFVRAAVGPKHPISFEREVKNYMKKSYTTPQLTVHGTVAQITQATNQGPVLDKTFYVGTPVTQVNIPESLKCS